MKGILTISHLIGSLFVMYAPLTALAMWEAFTKSDGQPWMGKVALTCLMTSPIYNGFIFGLKNKVREHASFFHLL